MYTPYQFQPFNQPFAPSLPSMQQPVQVAPTSGLTGHLIGSHEEIQPSDVPMNGQAAYFPAQDGSVIFAKQWNPNGTITTVRYVPEMRESEGVEEITLQDIVDQLSDIRDMLKKPATTRKSTPKKTTEKTTEKADADAD